MQDRKWLTLAVVALGTLMTALDASIVNISLPSIARTFHAPIAGAIEWVVIAYLVVMAASLLTFGRLSDLVGRKPLWVTGLTVFTLGSAGCGAAGSLEQLIVWRVVQGLGGALMFAPASPSSAMPFLRRNAGGPSGSTRSCSRSRRASVPRSAE
jgi:MFS family permease